MHFCSLPDILIQADITLKPTECEMLQVRLETYSFNHQTWDFKPPTAISILPTSDFSIFHHLICAWVFWGGNKSNSLMQFWRLKSFLAANLDESQGPPRMFVLTAKSSFSISYAICKVIFRYAIPPNFVLIHLK